MKIGQHTAEYAIAIYGYGASFVIALSTVAAWLITGAHLGWTQTKIPYKLTDEITGITTTKYKDGLIVGVECLGGGLALAIFVFLLTFIFLVSIYILKQSKTNRYGTNYE